MFSIMRIIILRGLIQQAYLFLSFQVSYLISLNFLLVLFKKGQLKKIKKKIDTHYIPNCFLMLYRCDKFEWWKSFSTKSSMEVFHKSRGCRFIKFILGSIHVIFYCTMISTVHISAFHLMIRKSSINVLLKLVLPD